MRKRHQQYMGIIMAACSFNAYAAPQAGNIGNFDGALTDYIIERDGKFIPEIKVYMAIYPDDRICITKNHSVDIRQCGEAHKITHKDSPYRVQPKKCKVPGPLDNLWLNFKSLMQYLLTIKSELPKGIYTKSEEESPVMPMLVSTPMVTPTLKAGKRALSLQWFGGKPPYRVQITNGKKELWQNKHEIKERFVKTTKILHFKAGHSYSIIITAANHAKRPTELEFEAVAKLPDYPKPLQALPENMRRTFQAAWLAEQNRIKWSFEAYQQLSDIANNYGPARELRKWKALGR